MRAASCGAQCNYAGWRPRLKALRKDGFGCISPCGWCNPVAKRSSPDGLSPRPRRGFLPVSLPLRVKVSDLVNPTGWRKGAAVNWHPVCAGQKTCGRSTAPVCLARWLVHISLLQKDLVCTICLQRSRSFLQKRNIDSISRSSIW